MRIPDKVGRFDGLSEEGFGFMRYYELVPQYGEGRNSETNELL